MMNIAEKQFATAKVKEISLHTWQALADDSHYAFVKALANYVQKTTPRPFPVGYAVNELSSLPAEDVEKLLEMLYKHIVEIGTEDQEETERVPTYSTGQMAQFFGVSITTINNWIRGGRITGIPEKKRNKHAQIPENATFYTVNWKPIKIKEVIESYHKQQETISPLPEEEELKEIRALLATFQEKYHGEYHETLGKKPVEKMTVEEKQDAFEWVQLLLELEDRQIE